MVSNKVSYVERRDYTVREVPCKDGLHEGVKKSVSLHGLVHRLVKFALVVDVEARQSVD